MVWWITDGEHPNKICALMVGWCDQRVSGSLQESVDCFLPTWLATFGGVLCEELTVTQRTVVNVL